MHPGGATMHIPSTESTSVYILRKGGDCRHLLNMNWSKVSDAKVYQLLKIDELLDVNEHCNFFFNPANPAKELQEPFVREVQIAYEPPFVCAIIVVGTGGMKRRHCL